MALRKLRFASSRCSAGELTFGEFGSELCESPEGRPRVKSDGLAAMVALSVGWCRRGVMGGKGNGKSGGRLWDRVLRDTRTGKPIFCTVPSMMLAMG